MMSAAIVQQPVGRILPGFMPQVELGQEHQVVPPKQLANGLLANLVLSLMAPSDLID